MENIQDKQKVIFIDEKDVVYVIVRNDTIFNSETQENDEYTKIIRVFQTESKANEYVEVLKSRLDKDANVQIFAIPTPFGDIE